MDLQTGPLSLLLFDHEQGDNSFDMKTVLPCVYPYGRGQSLVTGRNGGGGAQNSRGGQVKFYPYMKEGGGEF